MLKGALTDLLINIRTAKSAGHCASRNPPRPRRWGHRRDPK